MLNKKMKFAVVTTFPPGGGSLNEYAYHFVRYLRLKLDVSEIVLLTDELHNGEAYPEHSLGEEAGAPVIVDTC